MTMSASFIWDTIVDIVIVQPPLQQLQDSCSFSATVRQLEYQARIAYAEADVPCKFHGGSMLTRKWKPWELLKQLDKWSDGIGCPTFNGSHHWVRHRYVVDLFGGDDRKVRKMGSILAKKIPVIGVFFIFPDYPSDASRPYIGVDEDNRPYTEYPEDFIKNRPKHAVVIVGEYVVTHDNNRDSQHALEPGTYWIYQDSIQPESDYPGPAGLFGNFIGILHPRVVDEAYFGKTRIPNLMLSNTEALTQKELIDECLSEKLTHIAELRMLGKKRKLM